MSSGLREAVLSIGGASATNLWAVGADAGAGPIALHYDGASWTRVSTGSTGTLWWTQVFPDGTVFMAGAQSTILRSTDGTTFTRMQTPGLASYTIFGLWGASPIDMYAVGSASGRNGFIWHYDGIAWSDVPVTASMPLTPTCDTPGFFKVWGDGMGRVYVTGGKGVFLRRDGAGDFQAVDTGVDVALFTVHGTSGRAVMVGGAGEGTILEAPVGTGATSVAPAGTPLMQGLALEPNGHGWASGLDGTLLERSDGSWHTVDTGLSVPAIESLQAMWIDPSGGA